MRYYIYFNKMDLNFVYDFYLKLSFYEIQIKIRNKEWDDIAKILIHKNKSI